MDENLQFHDCPAAGCRLEIEKDMNENINTLHKKINEEVRCLKNKIADRIPLKSLILVGSFILILVGLISGGSALYSKEIREDTKKSIAKNEVKAEHCIEVANENEKSIAEIRVNLNYIVSTIKDLKGQNEKIIKKLERQERGSHD